MKIICKYYLKFPPVARKAIGFSISSIMSSMVDYYHSNVEDLLIECGDLTNIKN